MMVLLFDVAVTSSILGYDWNDLRNHETMIFNGQSMSEYLSVPVDQIFLYSYRESDNSWHQITFQIDELDGNEGYFNSNYNGIVDANDEFLFMASDAGDYAPSTSWVDDADSRQYIRYQIQIVNPDNFLASKYVYLYRSSVLTPDPALPSYIHYVAPTSGSADTIKAIAYVEGHNTRGIPDVWRLADSTGAYGLDLLDRQKARVKGTYKPLPFISISYNMNENDLQVDDRKCKIGPIRIIRDIAYKTEMSGYTINVGTFRYRYYPDHIVSLGATRRLESDFGLKLIRQSFDLNDNAIGMLFNNIDNFDIVIDGVPETANSTVYPSPTMNWSMYSGINGTIFVLNEFTPPSNANSSLYFHESLNNTTGDGTSDTGDGKSYGDMGIIFQGSQMVGSISLPYQNYFLPGENHRVIGETLASNAKNPMWLHHSPQNFTPPAELVISLPDTSGPALYPISIPVLIGNAKGLNVISSELAIQFDSQVLQAIGINTVNTMVENWDSTSVRILNDTIFVVLQGTAALQESGVLVYLSFDAIGSEGQQSPLHFIQAKFNTWNPLAKMRDGKVSLLPTPEVLVAIPDSFGVTKTEVSIPIRLGDVAGLNITRCAIVLQYSRYVLDAIALDTTETLAAGWTNISFTDFGGRLTIELSGATPLDGSGPLVWIKFRVTGTAGLITNIAFKDMVFNQGVPLSKTIDGHFTVTSPLLIDVMVSIDDTTVQSLSALHLPVLISSINDYVLLNYNLDLKFDQTVLEFKGVDTTATVASNWGVPLVNYYFGRLSMIAGGDVPIDKDGALIYLDFNVIGADSSKTTVQFSKMSFNSGVYIGHTADGTVKVLGVVPVELSSFSVVVSDREVKLQWNTATESNNFGFFVQRTADLNVDWKTIGFVPGKGTTTVPQQYFFVDANITPRIWYYRLQQQDLDGEIHYSQTIEVSLMPTKFALYQNYPNPFNSSTLIKYELPVGEHQVDLIIYDILGHQVRKLVDKEDQQAGAYQISWNGRDDAGLEVPSGVYFYRFQSGNQIFVKKIVLIE